MYMLKAGKLIRLMLLLGCWISLHTVCLAQSTDSVLDQPIILSFEKVTLGQLLEEIGLKTSLSFSYSSDQVPVAQSVNVPAGEKTIKQLLDAILLPIGFTYILLDKQVVIRKNTPAKTGKSNRSFTISGYVREEGSQESLIGVNVYVPGTITGTTTNTYGFYSLTLPASDSTVVAFSFVGYQTKFHTLRPEQSVELDVRLEAGIALAQVEVRAEAPEKVSEMVQMSRVEIPVAQIKKVPALLGEKDVMKALQLMPGVQKGTEGSSGLYVRGGGPDQNLIILDDAVVYNVNHLFGFFSLFNGDALKSVELTKGGFPARYGGRLSSVIEMHMKEGNKEKLHGEGGVGIISSRLTLEGPLAKGKSSFLISGRRTYADLLVRPFIKQGDGGYYFYDLSAKINYDFGRRNKLYASGYFGKDAFFLRTKDESARRSEGLNWGNATSTLRWNHLFNEKLFTNTSLVFSNYVFSVFESYQKEAGPKYAARYFSGIRDFTLKHDYDFFPNPAHAIKFGVTSTYHRFRPNAIVVKDTEVDNQYRDVEAVDALESAIYLEDTYRPLPELSLNLGLRLSHFVVQNRHYARPEPRVAAAYRLGDNVALKASYAAMNQYIHLLSNTGLGLPTDLWVPATRRIRPQQSQQVALGIAKDIGQRGVQFSLEGYYKKMNNIIGYREGADFLSVESRSITGAASWESQVTAGQGWSYGVELLLQKKMGRFMGWVGYTLSKTEVQFDSLNRGRKFFPRYDRRHDISLVGIYEISPRVTLSATWVYGTGNVITLPTALYVAQANNPAAGGTSDNTKRPLYTPRVVGNYSDRNNFRMAAYHRFDVSLQFHKQKKRHERTWEIGLYNAYNRKNPFFYYIIEERLFIDNSIKAKLFQVSLFPLIPSVSYNFKF